MRLSGLCALLLASFALAAPAVAGGRDDRFTPACAERDLRAISFIEQQSEAGGIPSAALAMAGYAYLQARLSCLAGNEIEALAIYDRIVRAEIFAAGPRH